MKKVFSIVLLFVFLFNIGGYYFVFWALHHQANKELTTRLDAELYSTEETIELKIPVVMPYSLPRHEDFKRVDGQFEYNGEHYKLVKQKFQYDTLYVVCIRDIQTESLTNAIMDYALLSNDLPGTTNKALNFLGKLLKDFDSSSAMEIISYPGWNSQITFSSSSSFFTTPVMAIQSPPPRV